MDAWLTLLGSTVVATALSSVVAFLTARQQTRHELHLFSEKARLEHVDSWRAEAAECIIDVEQTKVFVEPSSILKAIRATDTSIADVSRELVNDTALRLQKFAVLAGSSKDVSVTSEALARALLRLATCNVALAFAEELVRTVGSNDDLKRFLPMDEDRDSALRRSNEAFEQAFGRHDDGDEGAFGAFKVAVRDAQQITRQ